MDAASVSTLDAMVLMLIWEISRPIPLLNKAGSRAISLFVKRHRSKSSGERYRMSRISADVGYRRSSGPLAAVNPLLRPKQAHNAIRSSAVSVGVMCEAHGIVGGAIIEQAICAGNQ